MTYGDKRDYRKIDLHVYTGTMWQYAASTTWARTCNEAKEQWLKQHSNYALKDVRANYAKP